MEKTKYIPKELIEIAQKHSVHDRISLTAVPHLRTIRYDFPVEPTYSILTPSVCFVVQGSKEAVIGDKTLVYGPTRLLVNSIHVPIRGKVLSASPSEPYLCFVLDLNPADIFEISQNLNQSLKSEAWNSAITIAHADQGLIDAFLRLVRTLEKPNEVLILSPLIVKEITYRLLVSDAGNAVRQMGIIGSQLYRISKAIDLIRTQYEKPLAVNSLAQAVNMSPSALFLHFKRATNMSPIQYQKQIRLEEAKRLLLAGQENGSSVAYKVGYESPSQFNREYRRFFGLPPQKDIERMRKNSIDDSFTNNHGLN